MAAPEQPQSLPCAWGASAEIPSIPETTSEAGYASWQAGFPPITGTAISQGGIPPRYDDFQSVLNTFSKFCLYQQAGGTFAWSATQDYPAGALVRGSDGALYISKQATGPSTTAKNPVTDTSGAWSQYATVDDVFCNYEQVTDSSVAYSKSVPAGAASYVQISRLGGKTVRWNQMVPNGDFSNGSDDWTPTRGNLSVETGQATYTVTSAHDSASGNRIQVLPQPIKTAIGQKLFVHADVKIVSEAARAVYIFTADTTSTSGMGSAYTRVTLQPDAEDFQTIEGINTVLDLNAAGTVGFRLLFAHSLVGEQMIVKNCFCVNLTELYGAGNEPTSVEQFRQTYPAAYYAYDAGSLKSFGVASVTSSANGALLDTFSVPYAIRNMDGYGWSAGSAYNYVDLANAKFVRNVAAVDLGTLNWSYITTWGTPGFAAKTALNDAKYPLDNVTLFNGLCAEYQTASRDDIVNTAIDKTICLSMAGILALRDVQYSTVADLKTALSGVILYYELAEAEETDISGILYSNFVKAQAGGTLMFHNVAGTNFLEDVYSQVDALTGDWTLEQCVQKAMQSVPTRAEYAAVVDSIDNYFSNPLGNMYRLPSLLDYRPTSAGETADSSVVGGETQKLRALQAPFYDPFDNVLYFTKTSNGSIPSGVAANKNRLWAIHWSEDPAKRTVIASTGWGYDVVSHQSNSLYRPSRQDEPLIFCGPVPYNADGTAIDWTQTNYRRWVRWDYKNNPSELVTVKTVVMYDLSGFTSNPTRYACISADMKYIVTRVTASGTDTYRVYDAKQVYDAPDGADVSGDYISMFTVPNVASGQGIYCDGRYIYTLTSGSPNLTRTAIYDLNGRTVHPSQARKTGGEDYADSGYTYTAEAEGYFWANWYGKTEMFEAFSLAVHDVEGNPNSWTRRDSFNLLTIPECSFLDSAATITSDIRPLAGTSANQSLVVKAQNVRCPDNAYFFVSHYRNNDIADPTTTNVQQNVICGFTETGTGAAASIGFEEYAIGDTAASARLYPVQSNLINLGGASNLWKEAFIANATINTSDERKKDNIDDVDEALMRAWGKVNFKTFQFRDALEKKGENARLHVGVIAQQVAEAFASEGLDASRYGLFCYDEWEDQYETETIVDAEAVIEEITVIDAEAVLNELGEEIEPARTHIEKREIKPAVTHTETKLVTPAGSAYGIRYAEALALECAYQRWRLNKIEEQINATR